MLEFGNAPVINSNIKLKGDVKLFSVNKKYCFLISTLPENLSEILVVQWTSETLSLVKKIEVHSQIDTLSTSPN